MTKTLPLPSPPHDRVRPDRCEACGQDRPTRPTRPTRFSDAVALVLEHNADNPDFFLSRGPVLHAMRVLALSRWYGQHAWCDAAPVSSMPDSEVPVANVNISDVLAYLNRPEFAGQIELARIPFHDFDESPIIGGQLVEIAVGVDELDGQTSTTIKTVLRTTDGGLVQLGTSAVLVSQLQDLAGVQRAERLEREELPGVVELRMGERLRALKADYLVFIFTGLGEASTKGRNPPRMFQVARFKAVRDLAELHEHVLNMRQVMRGPKSPSKDSIPF